MLFTTSITTFRMTQYPTKQYASYLKQSFIVIEKQWFTNPKLHHFSITMPNRKPSPT